MSTTHSSTAPSPLLAGLMLWALYVIPVIVCVRPVGEPLYDPDVWWHLRVGQWIWSQGSFPANDPFTQEGRPWVAYSWLYEVVLFGLYRAFGLAGIILYRTLMALAIVGSIHALVVRLERRFLVSSLLTGIAILALAMLFSERPWLFTVLFTTLTLYTAIVLREPGPPVTWPYFLPLIYILWANIHIQFIYGLFVLGLACAAPFADRYLRWRTPDGSAAWPGSPRWKQLLTVTILCTLATLVNPYHARLYGVVLEYAAQPGPFRWVNELKALEFREASDWVMLALTGVAVYALGKRRPQAFEIALVTTSAFFAFRARRDLWFIVLADLLILATARPRLTVTDMPRIGVVGYTAILAGLLGMAALRGWQQDLSEENLDRIVAKKFPVKACEVVRSERFTGPLFNDFNWGGYLIWALPDLPVAVDGRTNLHGDARLERYGQVWSGLPGWDKDDDLSKAGLVIAPADTALASLLRLDRRFRRVHEDDIAVVFVREGGRD